MARDAVKIKTTEAVSFIDITLKVLESVRKASLKDGFVILNTAHTTTALCVNERCNRLQEDMKAMLERIIPREGKYLHNLDTVDDRANAHSHLRSLFLKTNEVIPVVNGKLQLGTWQCVFFIELDGPRPERNINLTFVGEFNK